MQIKRCLAVGLGCISVLWLVGCASTASDLKLSSAGEAKKVNVADFGGAGRIFAFFNLQGGALQVERVQTNVTIEQLESIKANNARVTKDGGTAVVLRDCVVVQQDGYAPCFDMNVNNQRQYLFTSIFRRDALDGARGVTGAILSPLTMSLGVVSSILSLDPKQAERAAQSTKRSTTRAELDVEALTKVGAHVEDQLAGQRRIVMQALNTQQTDSLERYGKPLVQGLVSTRDIVNTYRVTLSNEEKRRYLSVLDTIHRNQSNSQYAEQLFYRATVNTFADVPQWSGAMVLWGHNPGQYAEKVTALPGFGVNLTAANFVQSNEYKYALRYMRPQVSAVMNTVYGLEIRYPNKTYTFTQSAECKSEGRSYQTASAGFFEGWLGNVRDRTNTYEKYHCAARGSNYQTLEERLTGSTQASNKLAAPWKHFVLVESVANRYAGSSPSASSSSSSGSGKRYQCKVTCMGPLYSGKGSFETTAYGADAYKARDAIQSESDKACRNIHSNNTWSNISCRD